jgi:hypothetical protein
MINKTQTISELLELANKYPSPHNGQPIEVQQRSDNEFDVLFCKKRGLQATEVSYLFSYVTMGVFLNHLTSCAKALGHKLSYDVALPKVALLRGDGVVRFATFIIAWNNIVPNKALHQTLLFRQTSRKKYYQGINDTLSSQTIAIAAQANMKLVKMDRAGTHQAIWLNQRAVFDDMFDNEIRHELNYWLRYSKQEKESKKDGLAYDCMELNGRIMKFIVKHYKILRMPGVSTFLKKYYLRTMSDDSDAFYLLSPFSNEQEAFEVGTVVMQIWEAIAAQGYYLHPFGTIMSNVAAHNDFLKVANIEHETIHENYLVFIYRAGKSELPHTSLRIPVKDHLMKNQDV